MILLFANKHKKQKMRVVFVLISLLSCSVYSFAVSVNEAQIKAEKILKKLYQVNGNYTKGAAPKIIINQEKGGGASYEIRHQIHLDLAIVDMCESFGKQSEDALAYILAHELAHSYQKGLKATSFWEYYLHKDCTKNEERAADVFGVFNAYLAGYKTVKIVPQVIEKVYELYELQDQLSGYPPKQERMIIATEVQTKVKDLIRIYEAANYLSAIGKYNLAAASYQHILQFYQGREIYNNLGVNYALQAMNFTNKDHDLYLYPLELDWVTRMKKPKTDRGGEELSESEKAYRNRMLTQALGAFEKASKIDKRYFTATVNKLCVYNLMGDYLETIKQYGILQKNSKAAIQGATSIQQEKIKLTAAIAKAHVGAERQSAYTIWESLEKSMHKEIAWQAMYNLRILEEGKCAAPEAYSCKEPFSSRDRIDNAVLYRMNNVDLNNQINLDTTEQIQLVIEPNTNSMIFRYLVNGKPSCSLQQIYKPKTTKPSNTTLVDGYKLDIVTTTNGYLNHCAENKSVFLMSSDNVPKEWAKYYVH